MKHVDTCIGLTGEKENISVYIEKLCLRMTSLNMAHLRLSVYFESRCSCFVQFLNKRQYFALQIKIVSYIMLDHLYFTTIMPGDTVLPKMVN